MLYICFRSYRGRLFYYLRVVCGNILLVPDVLSVVFIVVLYVTFVVLRTFGAR